MRLPTKYGEADLHNAGVERASFYLGVSFGLAVAAGANLIGYGAAGLAIVALAIFVFATYLTTRVIREHDKAVDELTQELEEKDWHIDR